MTSGGTTTAGSGSQTDGSTTGGPAEPAIAHCRPSCTTPNDCAGAGPAHDADHYDCVDGGCFWLGCFADSDCPDDNVCRPIEGTEFDNYCVAACSNASSCGGGLGPYVSSNYSCSEGACVFEGCTSDEECEEVHPALGCFPELNTVCLFKCNQPSDCATAGGQARDGDNYECIQGACIYQGCNDDSECDETQVCRAVE